MQNELRDNLDNEEEGTHLMNLPDTTSAYKHIAIRNIVDMAMDQFPDERNFHRFGMSDDDPKNVDLAIKAMCDYKKKYLENRFFVINTHHGEHAKLEVYPIVHAVTGIDDDDEEIR